MTQTLLLADDSHVIHGLIERGLAELKVELIASRNGDEAIEMARSLRPDIVLADIGLPGQNGYQLCRAIKESPELGHIPVVLLAGAFEPFDPEKVQASGADDIITKPFESATLVERVKVLLAPSDLLPLLDPLLGSPLEPSDEALQAASTPEKSPKPAPLPDDFILAEEILADEVEWLGESEPVEAAPLLLDELIDAEPLGEHLDNDPFADENFDFGAPVGPDTPLALDSFSQAPDPLSPEPHPSGPIVTKPSEPEPPELDLLETSPLDDEEKRPGHPINVQPAIRDALGKIAGEAFSELPETVTKALIERIEAIAWEVIPQMTEVLIREEIRRMKEGQE
jgi:CheY-like chemotaxis protein